MVRVAQDAAEQSSPPDFQAEQPPIPSGCPTPLSAADLALILANPEDFGLATGVWYALDAPAWLVANRPAHTLAGRLDVSVDRLEQLAMDADLYRKASRVTKDLAKTRTRPSVLPVSIQRFKLGNTLIRCTPTDKPKPYRTHYTQENAIPLLTQGKSTHVLRPPCVIAARAARSCPCAAAARRRWILLGAAGVETCPSDQMDAGSDNNTPQPSPIGDTRLALQQEHLAQRIGMGESMDTGDEDEEEMEDDEQRETRAAVARAEALRAAAVTAFDEAGQAELQVERERAALMTLERRVEVQAAAAFAQLQRVRAAEEEAATTRAAADDAADMAKVARREPASSTRPVSISLRLERADARRWLAGRRWAGAWVVGWVLAGGRTRGRVGGAPLLPPPASKRDGPAAQSTADPWGHSPDGLCVRARRGQACGPSPTSCGTWASTCRTTWQPARCHASSIATPAR